VAHTVLLEHKHVACYATLDWQNLLPSTFMPGSINNSSKQPSFEMAIETISDLEKIGRQRSSHVTAISRLLTLHGT